MEMPGIIDRKNNVDKWIKTHDKESFKLAREIVKTEGIMVGGSCGAIMEGAI